MSLDTAAIAQAISGHKFQEAYPYLAPDIKWTVVGGEEILGRDAVIAACQNSDQYLSAVTTTFSKFTTTITEHSVIIESIAAYKDADNPPSTIACCDIYQFSNDQLAEITSYNIELK